MSEPNSKLPNLTTKTEEFITNIEETAQKALYEMTPEKAREFLHEIQKKSHKNIEADVSDSSIFLNDGKSIPIRVVRPQNNSEKLPAIVYIHGGGWVLGGKDEFDMFIRNIALKSNAAVIFPEYPLSPESRYPEALNQIYEAIKYISQNPEEFNINNEKIALVGDSAGANMATVLALRAKNTNGPKFLFQSLFYPVTNIDMDTESYKSFKEGPWLTAKAMEWFFKNYVSDKKLKEDAYISPLKADIEDLKGLPPTLIITAENDVLRDEGEAYARKLELAGVEVLNIRINGMIHDFLMINEFSDTPQVKWLTQMICCLFNDFFGRK